MQSRFGGEAGGQEEIKMIKGGFLFSICQTVGGWVEAEEGEGLTRESGQPVENSQVIRCLFCIVCIYFICIRYILIIL